MATATKPTKTEIVRELLCTEEGSTMSTAEIAERVGCDEGTVRRAKAKVRLLDAPTGHEVRMVPIGDLNLSEELPMQMRPSTDERREREFAEDMAAGREFPPITVVDAPEGLLVPDGWHRIAGRSRAGFDDVLASVREGTLDDAILLAVQANSESILPRCPQTKRNAVMTLLRRWPEWTDERIREAARVSPQLVKDVRAEFYAESKAADSDFAPPAKLEARDGRKYDHTPPPTRDERKARPSNLNSQVAPESEAGDHEWPDEVVTIPAPAPVVADEPETDREWLERHCGSTPARPHVRDRLSPEKRRVFDAHAIVYRRMTKTIAAFKQEVNSVSGQKDVGGLSGGIMTPLNKPGNIPHPRDWIVCYDCKGSGLSGGSECQANGCRGRGWKLS